MKKILCTVALIFGVSWLWGTPAAAALKVVATTTDLGWLAEQVGGVRVEVAVLCPGYQDPHYLPAKPSLSRKLRKADLLVYNGLELEIGWLPLLVDAARNPRLKAGGRGELDCSRAVTEILEVPTGPVDRSQGDIHPLGNPHYLLDPHQGIAVGHLIAGRLAELDPAGADVYQQQAVELERTLTARMADWQQTAGPAIGQSVIIYHQQFEYLLDWLGMSKIGAIEHRPGISPSPRHVEEVIKLGQTYPSTAVLAAPWNHLDAARRVSERVEAPLVVLPAASGALEGSDDYLAMFETICELLGEAFKPAGD
jgi:zinc/manganese transport system substrate-binding protein